MFHSRPAIVNVNTIQPACRTSNSKLDTTDKIGMKCADKCCRLAGSMVGILKTGRFSIQIVISTLIVTNRKKQGHFNNWIFTRLSTGNNMFF